MPGTHASDELTIDRAAELLGAGEVVAIPTETVYGLAADAANPDAVLKIFEIKNRPRINPLIVHCASLSMAQPIAEFSPQALRLAVAFWPGPLTMVLPRREDAPLADLVTAGLDTVAVRVPGHGMARGVIERVGRPVAAPSANPSGRLSPTTADAVRAGFGNSVPVLDGGRCAEGLESTIVAVGAVALILLRPGAIPRADIEAVAGRSLVEPATGNRPVAPGMMAAHYAPLTPLRLEAGAAEPGEALLAFGPEVPATEGPTRNLSETGDLREAARNLFSHLRALDATKAKAIAVMPIPETGLGEAINDRLRRAAAG